MPFPLHLADGPVALRPLAPADAPLLLRWLTDPRNLAYWEGPSQVFTPERIQRDFYEDADPTFRCIVQYQGRDIGYAQFYQLDEEGFQEYQYPVSPGPVFGMDQFIGEPDLWGQGIGRRFIRLLTGHLFAQCRAQAVVLDPHADNLRAIRCYEACGFRKRKFLPKHELHDGELIDCWLMELPAPDA